MAKKKELKSAGEISNLVTDFENKHSSLHARMDADFDLWRLKEYKLDAYSDNVTSTYPRFYAQAVLGQLSGAKLNIAIHRMDGQGELESKMERAFFGWLRVIDEGLVNRLLPPLQSSVSFMAAIRGFIAGRNIFYKDGTPEIFPYDPRHLSWGMDSKGIIWSGYTTYREPYAIEFEYEYTPKPREKVRVNKKEISKAVEVIEWIDEDSYQVIVDDMAVNDEKDQKHDWGRPPVVLVPVGTTPLIISSSDKYGYVETWGDSVFGGSRGLYKVQSAVLSICLSLLAKSHRPSYFLFTPDGSMKLQGTPWGKGEILPLPIDAKVEQVKPPDIASSWYQFYQIIDGLIHQADYPSLTYGQLWKGQELSGKSVQSLNENVEQIKGTLLQAMSTFYKTSLKKLGEQYLKLGEPSQVAGYDSKGRRFVDQATPDLFDGDYELEIEFRAISPEQESANYAKAQVAKQSMLASDDFIREKLIQFQDPELIRDQMYSEKAELLSPKVMALRVIESLRKQGKEQEADVLANELAIALKQETMQQGQPQGQPMGQPPQGGQPPRGQPQQMPQGMPPQGQPPMGGMGGM